MDFPLTLRTGAGAWNPILWLVGFGVAFGLAWLIRSFGRPDNREGNALKPFVSGNDEPPDAAGHLPASNLYWGFSEAMKSYYKRILPPHTGIPTDYVAWFLGVMALMLVIALTV